MRPVREPDFEILSRRYHDRQSRRNFLETNAYPRIRPSKPLESLHKVSRHLAPGSMITVLGPCFRSRLGAQYWPDVVAFSIVVPAYDLHELRIELWVEELLPALGIEAVV